MTKAKGGSIKHPKDYPQTEHELRIPVTGIPDPDFLVGAKITIGKKRKKKRKSIRQIIKEKFGL